MSLSWKVVESQTVDAEWIEEQLNRLCADGWEFFTMHFAMKPNSRRPAMVFLLFTRELRDEESE